MVGDNILPYNWNLLGQKTILSLAHETLSWYLLGILFSEFLTSTPVLLIWETPHRRHFTTQVLLWFPI